MPELPEVEIASRQLRSWAKGKRVLAKQRRENQAKKQRLYDQLSPAERRQTEDLLHRLAQVIVDL